MNEYINEDGKRVFYLNEDEWRRISDSWNTSHINLEWHKIVWKILTDRKFRWLLKETIFYAVRWESQVRGSGSTEVFLFTQNFNEIFKFKNKNTSD